MHAAGVRRSIEIVLANPAGNITAFVVGGGFDKPDERAYVAQKIMERELPLYVGGMLHGMVRVEQTGFVRQPAGADKLWRLEMAGGEFCGNAARSFALLAARTQGILPEAGSLRLPVAVSGASKPLEVCITAAGGQTTAAVAMPLPSAHGTVQALGQEFAVYHFEGISHIIACGAKPDRDTFFAIKTAVEASIPRETLHTGTNGDGVRSAQAIEAEIPEPVGRGIGAESAVFAGKARKNAPIVPSNGLQSPFPAALGVMFCPPFTGAEPLSMTPAVYVYNPESFLFESSCGSGSAAFAYHYFADREGGGTAAIRQPGGVIEASVQKEAGKISRVEIGGPVVLSDPQPLLLAPAPNVD